MLSDSGVSHREGDDDESERDTGDRTELDVRLAQRRVDDAVEYRDQNDNRDGVEVLHEIVGDSMTVHLLGLRDEVVGELTVAEPVDGVEEEDLAGGEGSLDLLDVQVVPWDADVAVHSGQVGRLGSVHVAVLDHHECAPEGVGNDALLWWSDDDEFLGEEEDGDADDEHAETHQVCGPESDVQLHVWSRNKRERTKVDTGVEHHVDPLDRDRWVNDYTLAVLLGSDGHRASLILVGDQWCDVGLDTTSTGANDEKGNDEASNTGAAIAVVDDARDRRDRQDKETSAVNDGEDENSVVTTEVLISNDGACNGSDCDMLAAMYVNRAFAIETYHNTRTGRK